jgi:hypothetical protein
MITHQLVPALAISGALVSLMTPRFGVFQRQDLSIGVVPIGQHPPDWAASDRSFSVQRETS